MKKHLFLSVLLVFVMTQVFSQETSGKLEERPDLPGELRLDIGGNILRGYRQPFSSDAVSFVDGITVPDWGMELKTLESRTTAISYIIEKPIKESAFSFNYGVGMRFDKYSFKKDITLVEDLYTTDPVTNGETYDPSVSLQYDTIHDIQSTKLAVNYAYIPLELRYHINKDDFENSIKIIAGVKLGYFINAQTKMTYSIEDDKYKSKLRGSYQLNKIMYAPYVRLAYKGFQVFYSRDLNTLFSEDRGPNGMQSKTQQLGISIDLF